MKQFLTILVLVMATTMVGQDVEMSYNIESTHPITWKKIMTLEGYQRDHIKALNRSKLTGLYNADTNEFNFRIGPIQIDYQGAGVDRKMPRLFRGDCFIEGVIEYNRDGYKYRVSVNSLEHVSWLNNSVMIDLSDFLELRNEVYHSDYFKSVDYTLTDFFQKFDVTEPDDDW